MIDSDQRPPGDDWLVRRVTDLERQVRELQAGRRLEAATIGAGGLRVAGGTITIEDGSLTVRHANGTELLHLGPGTVSGEPVRFMRIRRPDGSTVFFTYGSDDGDAFWALYDKSENIIVSDDGQSEQGLARPWLPLQAVPTSWHSARQQSTTSGTFTPLWTISSPRQHPRLRVQLMVQFDGGVAAEVQVRDPASGTVIAGPTALSAGAFQYLTMTGTLPSAAYLSLLKLDVEMRVSAGAGTVGCSLIYAQGIQS